MIKLHSAITNQIEPLQPSRDELTVLLVGDLPAGHMPLSQAFTLSAADTLVRYLAYQGWQVDYRLAFASDVEESSQANKPSDLGLSGRWHQQLRTFSHDAQVLNLRPPDSLAMPVIDDALPAERSPWSQVDILITAGDQQAPWNWQATAANDAVGVGDETGRVWLEIASMQTEEAATNQPGKRLPRLGDILKQYTVDTFRIYLAQQSIQESWSFDEAGLEKASRFSQKLSAALTTTSTGNEVINTTPAQNRFTIAMDKNLNTVKGIASLLNLADEILFRARNDYDIKDAQEVLRQMASVFGLDMDQEIIRKEIANGWEKFRQDLKEKTR